MSGSNNIGRNEQATCVLESYLRAANISHSPLPEGGIAVDTATGGHVHVVFTTKTTTPTPSVPTITVSPDSVLTTKKERTMSVFHEITERAGHGRPEPVDRGAEPVGVVNDFFLVSIRHRDFRTVPNPPDAELRAHEKLITEVCKSFHYRYPWLCAKKGYGVGDLKTFALTWATIFLGKYRRTRRSTEENEKLLRRHLEQRLFGEFSLRLQRDLRIDLIDTQTFHLATTGDVEGVREEAGDMDAEAEAAPRARMPELDLSSDEARRKSAKSLLLAKLSALSHEDLVNVLSAASTNASVCPDTRAEARRRLTLHKKKCAVCSPGCGPHKIADAKCAACPKPKTASAPGSARVESSASAAGDERGLELAPVLEMDEDATGADAGCDVE